MPDLMENIDVLASLRGALDILYDFIDEPKDKLADRINQVSDVYYEYFNRFYDVIKDSEGGNAYTVFQIWGEGKTVKLQCDFSAMLSPDDFRNYIRNLFVSRLKRLTMLLPHHLDGQMPSVIWMLLWRLMRLMLFNGPAEITVLTEL